MQRTNNKGIHDGSVTLHYDLFKWIYFRTPHVRKMEIRYPKGPGWRPSTESSKGSLGQLCDTWGHNFAYFDFLSQAIPKLPKQKITSLETKQSSTKPLGIISLFPMKLSKPDTPLTTDFSIGANTSLPWTLGITIGAEMLLHLVQSTYTGLRGSFRVLIVP